MTTATTAFMTEADGLVEQQKTTIEEKKPSLPIYENMPQCIKDKVREDGAAKFGEEIETAQKEQQEFIENATDFDKFKEKINEYRPDEKIKQTTTEFEDKIKEVEGNIEKASSLGGLGNLF